MSKKNKSRIRKKKSAKVQDEPPSSDPTSTSSSNDFDGYSSSDSGSSTSEHGTRRNSRKGCPSRSRPSRLLRRGPKHPGLKELPSTNIFFESLLWYRSYRLKKSQARGRLERSRGLRNTSSDWKFHLRIVISMTKTQSYLISSQGL